MSESERLTRAIGHVLADRYPVTVRVTATKNCKHHPHPPRPRLDFAIAA